MKTVAEPMTTLFALDVSVLPPRKNMTRGDHPGGTSQFESDSSAGAPGASRFDGALLRHQGVRKVQRCYVAVRSVPGGAVPQCGVLHQLGRGPRANFAIQRPEENAGRHEAVPSIIIDGGLLQEQKAS